eukprot:g18504.t1
MLMSGLGSPIFHWLDVLLQDAALLAEVFRAQVEENKRLLEGNKKLEEKLALVEREKRKTEDKAWKCEGDLAYQKALLFRITAAKLALEKELRGGGGGGRPVNGGRAAEGVAGNGGGE